MWFFSIASERWLLPLLCILQSALSKVARCKRKSHIINMYSFGRGCKVSQQRTHPLLWLRRLSMCVLPLDVSRCRTRSVLWPSIERGTWPSNWGLNTAAQLLTHPVEAYEAFTLILSVNDATKTTGFSFRMDVARGHTSLLQFAIRKFMFQNLSFDYQLCFQLKKKKKSK